MYCMKQKFVYDVMQTQLKADEERYRGTMYGRSGNQRGQVRYQTSEGPTVTY